MILLKTNEGDVLGDPFAGGGVSAYVAEKLKRRWIACDINDCSPDKERLIDLHAGRHPEWKAGPRRTVLPLAPPSPSVLFLPGFEHSGN